MTGEIDLSEKSLKEFFFDEIQRNCQQISLTIQASTHQYLVDLSMRFSRSDQLFLQDEDGLSLPTLAFLYRDALAAPLARDRQNLVRSLGDTALFLAACFPNVWQRRGLNRRYFISMGESAFETLVGLDRDDVFPYRELAKYFEPIADCLGASVFPVDVRH